MKSFPVALMAQARVLIVGDIMLDRYWFGAVDRISPEAPVPVVRVARREDRLGGAANVARNVAALGARASLLGVIGHDEAGRHVADMLAEAGIAAELNRDEAYPTTLKLRVLGRQQQLLRIDFEERPSPQALSGIELQAAQLLLAHDVLLLSDYAKGVLDRVEHLIELARAAAIPVLIDPKGDDFSRYRGATLLTPNRLELEQVIGRWNSEASLTERVQNLRRELDLEALLLTRSEQGMTLFSDSGRMHVDAQAQEVFDVSGAGDTVIATVAAMRAAGADWEQSIYWANQAAGIVVGKLGTSIVTAEELI
ncbi:D-glycero-beta-D-manno-heptose-7-phosphate kinase [Alcaligenaceae bacterium SJ-26]|nr:D-glycero-beta-D-manno-heptose-7-phosphate kinase [Alcaligenaceae bacterium SJ-26]